MIQPGSLPKPGPTLHFSPGPLQTDASSGPGYAPHPSAPGLSPQFGFNILNDPLYAQLQKQVGAQNQAAQAAFGTGVGQELAQYGQMPDLTGAAQSLGLNASSPLYALLTGAAGNPNTVAAANALTNAGLSTEAQNAQQHSTDIGNLMNNLAARGAVQSGDTGVGLRLADQADAQRQYQAQQTLLGHLANLVGTYNTQQQNDINQLQQGASQAAARQISLNPAVTSSLAQTIGSLLAQPFGTPATAGTTTTGGTTSGN